MNHEGLDVNEELEMIPIISNNNNNNLDSDSKSDTNESKPFFMKISMTKLK